MEGWVLYLARNEGADNESGRSGTKATDGLLR